MQVLRTTTIRALDTAAIGECGIPSLELMETAGRRCAERILQRIPNLGRRDVHILCGHGNNGGDGFVIARCLAQEGVRVRVYATHPPAHCSGECQANWEKLPAHVLVVQLHQNKELHDFREHLTDRDVVIDALLGVGIRGELAEPYRSLVAALADTPATVIAIDVPTGVGEDNGQVTTPAMRADITLTIGYPKVGMYLDPACHYCGEIEVIPLDYPDTLLADLPPLAIADRAGVAARLVPRSPAGSKRSYGRLLILGGSRGMAGSVALAGGAAFRAGCGMVAIATAASAQPTVAGLLPEAMTIPLSETPEGVISPLALPQLLPWLDGWATTLAFGPGLTTTPAARALVGAVLDHWAGPLVLDADALKIAGQHLERLRGRPAPAICTPHLGEAATLLGHDIEYIRTHRLEVALEAAHEHQLVMLLKGYRTVIAAPDGRTMISTVGNPGLATAGTGDVLTGIIGAMLGQGFEPFEAAWVGAYLHGAAGDRAAAEVGEISLMAGDVSRSLPAVIQSLQ